MRESQVFKDERNSLWLPIHRETLPDGLVDRRVDEVQPHQRDHAQRLTSQLRRKLCAPRHDRRFSTPRSLSLFSNDVSHSMTFESGFRNKRNYLKLNANYKSV